MKVKILGGNFCLIVSMLILVGCATMAVPPQYEPTKFSTHQESGGIKVSIEPFVDKSMVKKYFGEDLISDGIFPIYVRIENGSKDNSIFINENTFSLVLPKDSSGNFETNKIIDESGGVGLSVLGTVLISPPMMLLGGKMSTDASVINYTFNKNMFRPTTISPGKNASGFVYFSLPEKGIIPKSYKILATIENFSDDEKIRLIF